MGFEPTPPKRTELESVALDHSATDAIHYYFSQQRESNSRSPVYETDALTTVLCWRKMYIYII